ncbi:AMP-binding enzyme [Luteibacter jiangsuensis]
MKECYAVGVPDGDLGEMPVAFVVARPGCINEEDSLPQHIRQVLSRVMAAAH